MKRNFVVLTRFVLFDVAGVCCKIRPRQAPKRKIEHTCHEAEACPLVCKSIDLGVPFACTPHKLCAVSSVKVKSVRPEEQQKATGP